MPILNAQLQSALSLQRYADTASDAEAAAFAGQMLAAALNLLPRFDRGCWSEYSLDGNAATEDGKEVPVTGTPRMDSAVTTLKNPSTRHTVYKKGGKTVLELESVVSADGKTMTTTSKGVDASGKPVSGKSVYERQ